MPKPIFVTKNRKWLIIAISLGCFVLGSSTLYFISMNRLQSPPLSPVSPSPTQIMEAVSALGRLEPQGEVIQLAPSPDMGGSKLEKLLVKEGDKVYKGQVLAILDNLSPRQAAVNRAEKEVQVAQSQLAVIEAGAKTGEIEAQKAEIERLQTNLTGINRTYQTTLEQLQTELNGEKQEQTATIERLKAELGDAERDYQRYQKLAQEGVISEADLDSRSLKLSQAREKLSEAQAKLDKTIALLNKRMITEDSNFNTQKNVLEKQILEAKANLSRIVEVRTVDVQKAKAEIERTQASLKEAKTDLEESYVKSPINGTVLKINAYQGEQIDSNQGILELGKTEQMMAIAEVYESDINGVKVGQKAIIRSENKTFTGELKGTVQQIGLQVGKKDVLSTDPAADIDVRVIEVKILLDPESSRQVSSLTYAKVIVEILL